MSLRGDLLHRKGATKAENIPHDVIALLNQGIMESVNLTEWLAVNHISLLNHVLPSIGLEDKLEYIASELERQNAESGMKAIRLTGALLDKVMNEVSESGKEAIIEKCSTHVSDSVRCWAAFMNKKMDDTIEDKLSYIMPFAADHHFGVREIAWMSVREELSLDINKSVELLVEWAKSNNEYIRRFSVESIRPRGVWSKHIEELKHNPQLALPILNLLQSDPSTYVQDSVGNWLNDASKTQPEWVLQLCEQWEKDSDTKATVRIINKAKRTIMKNA
ncbi:DNA alkylation repair protein [Paenibacillus marinisediminis]